MPEKATSRIEPKTNLDFMKYTIEPTEPEVDLNENYVSVGLWTKPDEEETERASTDAAPNAKNYQCSRPLYVKNIFGKLINE